ncbi:hypothetical protein BDB00DRAFT_933150 [Zychaea mexicana]|uniref:uncharacterized protein n=1 Tax=Zychaea mexicana TaxID=64656 RepID=UPI0022FE17DD|nr:uncharacterized protein BDB00DRAFT_933150 [Zychaea mexicana]KAI9485140.1 hypothetical protein BDB00DRAFT_933150 [Zychaea mexicana]
MPGIIGFHKKPFKYPTSTTARGTSLTENTVRTECVFAHESLMITQTDDVTKRVSVKVLRLPEPPKLTPIRMPGHLQRRNTVRRSVKRPLPETRRRVQQQLQQQEHQLHHQLQLQKVKKEQHKRHIQLRVLQEQQKEELQQQQEQDHGQQEKKRQQEELELSVQRQRQHQQQIQIDDDKHIADSNQNISKKKSTIPEYREKQHHYHDYLHPTHASNCCCCFMPAVTQTLLQKRSNDMLAPDKKVQASTPSNCSSTSLFSIRSSPAPASPPPPSVHDPFQEQQQQQRNKTLASMFRWISSHVQNALTGCNVRKENRCSPLLHPNNTLYSNYSHLNVSCPTIVAPANDDDNEYRPRPYMRRPSPLFLDSTITL